MPLLGCVVFVCSAYFIVYNCYHVSFCRQIYIFLEMVKVVEKSATGLLILNKICHEYKLASLKLNVLFNILFNLFKEIEGITWPRGDTKILFGFHQSCD